MNINTEIRTTVKKMINKKVSAKECNKSSSAYSNYCMNPSLENATRMLAVIKGVEE